MKVGAFADMKKTMVEAELIIPNIQFSKLLTEKLSPPDPSTGDNNEIKSTTTIKETSSDHQNGNTTPLETDKRIQNITMMSTNDDFIMVELVN